MGYHRAGFDIVGVDIVKQPRYPFEFHRADALAYPFDGFDVIHASPPCQGYSRTQRIYGPSDIPRLIEPVRDRLQAARRPFVIENVEGAPLNAQLMLCGTMFELAIIRHRWFECNVALPLAPFDCNHRSGYGDPAFYDPWHTRPGRRRSVVEFRDALGCPWMVDSELDEAIPPAYTEWIGGHLL